MTNLIEFMSEIIGIDFDVNNPIIQALAFILGFLLVYQIITFVFGSIFAFTNKF